MTPLFIGKTVIQVRRIRITRGGAAFRHILHTLFLLTAGMASAQQFPNILVATGKEIFAEQRSSGVLECVGGQATGRPFQCSSGTSRVFIWNSVGVQDYEDVAGTATAMIRGRNTVLMHCNFDRNYYGHCWGTFDWEIPEMNGKWEGVWSGIWDYATNRVSYHLTGYGTGGQLEGLQIEKESAWPGGSRPGTFVVKILAKKPAP